MTSNIDPSKPTSGNAYTADVRQNFFTAQSEISNLQAGELTGSLGIFGATGPTAQPVVTGSRSDGTALASLLTALVAYGFIIDNSTA
jgi:hypothetical protein